MGIATTTLMQADELGSWFSSDPPQASAGKIAGDFPATKVCGVEPKTPGGHRID